MTATLGLAALAPPALAAQDGQDAQGRYPVDAATQVGRVSFEFTGGRTLPPELLRGAVALQDPRVLTRVLRGIRGQSSLDLQQNRQRFDPAEMVRDLERLRRLYERQGFPDASVDFRLDVDPGSNTVAVTYEVREGQPLRVGAVSVVDSAGTPLPAGLPEEIRVAWPSAADALDDLEGDRLSTDALAELERRTTEWLGERGYPRAMAAAAAGPRAQDRHTDVRVRVITGPRVRVDSILVRGLERLRPETIEDEIAIGPGDWVSTKALVDARREIMGLDMVRLAVLEVVPRTDSTAHVVVDVEEAPARLVQADVGYSSESGPSLEASWSHRDFLDRAWTFGVEGQATTGQWALVRRPDETVRLGLSLRQPHVVDRRTSLTHSLFGELSDDEVSRDRLLGVQSTLVFVESSALTLGLDVRLAHRWIDEYRLGAALGGGIDFLSLLTSAAQGVLGDVGAEVREADVGVEATLGPGLRVTDRGFLWSLRPRISASIPLEVSDVRYVRFDVSGQASRPLGGGVLVSFRAGAGHVEPFGRSLPGRDDDALEKFLLLRRVLLTGGGSGDVRGWGTSMLGPKFPEVVLELSGDTLRIDGRGFTPLGGTDKVIVSLQAEAPLPGLPRWLAGLAFLDGGRIWSSDDRFADDGELDQERFFWAAGGGLAVRSPVGRVEIAVGIKLNPSILDLASASDVLEAIVEERPLSEVPTKDRRRFHLHLAVGVGR